MDRLIIMKDGHIIKDLSNNELKFLSNSDLSDFGLRKFDLPKINVGKDVRGKNPFIACKNINYLKNFYRIRKQT